jgi:glycosyltransferase involved in cell wall biosynthesis
MIQATGMGRKNTGVGQYLSQLLPRLLPRLATAGCQVSVLLSKDAVLSGLDGVARIVRLPVPRDGKMSRVFWEQVYVPFLSWPADLYLSLLNVFPLTPVWAKRKFVVVQDIYHMLHIANPNLYPLAHAPARLFYINLAMRKTVSTADGIVALSQFTADQVHRFLDVATDRITTIPCGVDARRFGVPKDPGQVERTRKRYGLPEHFYLFVGAPGGSKNLRLIVETYAAGGNREIFFPVAITSQKRAGRLFDPTARLIEETRQSDSFRFLGFVPDQDLPSLYAAATALLYPSLHEGFGLPPLEAMACGTPVVTSNRTAIPEVVGDAALMIDPTQPQALLEALQKVNDESIRRTLIERGLKRVQVFTWERTAQLMAERILS